MSKWAIQVGDTVTEFKDAKLTGLHREWKSFDIGRCFFSAEKVAWDSDPAYAHMTPITILKDGQPWFHGKRLLVTHDGGSSREGLDYELVDAWWDVCDVTFTQQRLVFNDAGEAVYIDVTEYIYNQDPYAHKLHTGQMMTEALNCVLYDRSQASLPAPFTLGTVEPTADVPWRFEHDKKCIEVIREMQQWTPKAVGYLDHSTTPHPTLHIKLPSSMSSSTIYVPSNYERHEIRLKKREDLNVEAVFVAYKRIIPIGTFQAARYTVDRYPDGASQYGYRRVFQTVDLDNGNSGGGGGIEVEMKTALLDYNNIAWWEQRCPQYDHNKNKLIQISSIRSVSYDNTDANPSTWKNELVGGCIPTSTSFTGKQQVFRAIVRCKVWNEEAHTNLLFDQDIHIATGNLTVVNGGSGSGSNYYSGGSSESSELAEPTPSGLPATFYNGVNSPGWEGDARIAAREVGENFAGKVVNISGGRTEWQSMNAVPQSVSQDADIGLTVLTFGLPQHLSIQDLVELQRRAKQRVTFYSYERITGKGNGGKNQVPGSPLYGTAGAAISVGFQDVTQTES